VRSILWIALILGALFQLYWNWNVLVNLAEEHDRLSGWAQAVGSFVALGVAIWVPWQIHVREQRAAALPRLRNRAMLKTALAELDGGVDELINAEVLLGSEADGIPSAITPNSVGMLSENHEEILRALLQSSALLSTVLSRSEVDQYELLRPIMVLRERLTEFSPALAKEANILRKHPTIGVLQNSIPETAYIASELRVWIDQALAALAD